MHQWGAGETGDLVSCIEADEKCFLCWSNPLFFFFFCAVNFCSLRPSLITWNHIIVANVQNFPTGFRGQAGGGYWMRELCGSSLRRFSIQCCRRGRERRRDGCRGEKKSRGRKWKEPNRNTDMFWGRLKESLREPWTPSSTPPQWHLCCLLVLPPVHSGCRCAERKRFL